MELKEGWRKYFSSRGKHYFYICNPVLEHPPIGLVPHVTKTTAAFGDLGVFPSSWSGGKKKTDNREAEDEEEETSS